MRQSAILVSLAVTCLSGLPALADGSQNSGGSYHFDATHTGAYVVPGLTFNSAATLHRDLNFGGAVTGNIQGEALYYTPPGDGPPSILVTTDQNDVRAIDPTTGNTVWETSLGPASTTAVPGCGNRPLSGVGSTPVLDTVKGIAYIDAAVLDGNGTLQQRVFALSMQNGSVLPGWPLDIASSLAAKGITFSPVIQGQRGALQLVNGELYIPFGGNRGDCGQYHGMVVGVDVNAPGVLGAWVTGAVKGGIWAPGGVIYDGKWLFMTTGNANEGATWADGQAVFRLNPNLQHSSSTQDYFVPTNFAALDTGDLDLGGTAPVQIDVTGPQARAHWLLQLGKDGKAYILARGNLGGMGGALLVQQVANSQIHTGPAVYETPNAVYVAMNAVGSNCPGNPSQVALTTILITAQSGPVITTAWCGSLASRGAPIVTTVDGQSQPIVWLEGAGGDRAIHGYQADTGTIVFNGGKSSDKITGAATFATILAAQGRLFVGGGGQLYAFDFTPGL